MQDLEDSGYTPLMRAVMEQDRQRVEDLLLDGADVNAKGRHSLTALILSVRMGDDEVTRLLLDFGADTAATDMRGKTALHYAVRTGHVCIVRALLEHGANPNPVAHSGTTPLIYAVFDRQWDVMNLLLQWGACPQVHTDGHSSSALLTAVVGYDPHGNRLQAISALLEHGADVHYRSCEGKTVLQHLTERYEEVRRMAPDKAQKSDHDWPERWKLREERFAVAVDLLQQAARFGNR